MSKIWFYNEDCFLTMDKMDRANYKVDIVLTSPLITLVDQPLLREVGKITKVDMIYI